MTREPKSNESPATVEELLAILRGEVELNSPDIPLATAEEWAELGLTNQEPTQLQSIGIMRGKAVQAVEKEADAFLRELRQLFARGSRTIASMIQAGPLLVLLLDLVCFRGCPLTICCAVCNCLWKITKNSSASNCSPTSFLVVSRLMACSSRAISDRLFWATPSTSSVVNSSTCLK